MIKKHFKNLKIDKGFFSSCLRKRNKWSTAHKKMLNIISHNKLQIKPLSSKGWIKCWKDIMKFKLNTVLVGTPIGTITLENNLTVSHEVKHRITIWSRNSTSKCMPNRSKQNAPHTTCT